MRPIEFNGIINRTTDYAQLQQNENNRPIAEQANMQQHLTKQIEHNSETVVNPRNAEWKNEKFDAKEKGKNEYYSSKKNNKKNKEDGKVTVKPSVSFDVKI